MVSFDSIYDLAVSVQKLKPWNYLFDIDRILLSDNEKLVLFSVLGSEGFFYGIVIYEGLENVYKFQKFIDTKMDIKLEHHYVVDQSYILCRFVRPQDLNPMDIKYYQAKGIKLEEDSFYPSFVIQQKGYLPRQIKINEVERLASYLYHFKAIFSDILSHKLLLSFEDNDFIMRRFSEEKKIWVNEVGNNFRVNPPKYPSATLDDETLKYFLNRPRINNTIILDYRYLDYPVVSDKIKEAYFPLLVIAFDDQYNQVVQAKLCNPSDNQFLSTWELLKELFTKRGVPNEIIVVHEELFDFFSTVCHLLDITLKVSLSSPKTNTFFNEFNDFSIPNSNNNQYM